MVFPLFEGGAAIAAGGERSEGVALTQLPNYSAKANPPALSGCPLQKGGKTSKKQLLFLLLILMVFPLFEGGAAIAAGGERSEGVALTQPPQTKNPTPFNRGQGFC